ncbi:imelysin family protein [Rufibacter tibetensis]|uniref:Imelysin-like domain-containing protein n=1 Tax=Rufibacter tibetensis TaxID=512763 RepID=A0A0P0D080_9BACT|nr:imelysin family protein [Rufibacter tibetensis]ALJ00206.1 hypothetical protein DC20_16075 [Rufibacter tibetensis]
MANHKFHPIAAALFCLVLLAGCSSKEEDTPTSEYDRKLMLANYADNLLLPGYIAFKAEVGEMATAITSFTANPSSATLTNARKEYQEAYLAWQTVSMYEFGPADEQMLRNTLNIYPVTVNQIESNVNSGTYDLGASANLAAQGFPAIDYLLFGQATQEAVVEKFASAAQAANRKKYLQDITAKIKQVVDATHTAWTSGNTAQSFRESGGTAVGSSVGNLVNQLNFEIDLTKRAKVGIPAGKFTAGTSQPERTEAFYSKNSLALLKRNLEANRAIFLGQSAAGVNGPGLDDYLNHVDAAKKYNGKSLAEAITQQFDAALAAVNAITVPLSEAVSTQPQAVNKVYEELQKLIVLTKTDLPAALGVSITYTDNDGD